MQNIEKFIIYKQLLSNVLYSPIAEILSSRPHHKDLEITK